MDEQTHTAGYILNKPIFACFVDFSKAFDTVWHLGLFKNIIDLKIGGIFYKTIRFMYSNSKFIVKKKKIYIRSM